MVVTVSDEDNLGRPNIYWRLVRPGYAQDVGPLHRAMVLALNIILTTMLFRLKFGFYF